MKSEVADVMKLDKEYKLFIGGKWVSASDGKTFTTVCSATGEKLAECAEATKEDVDAAVKAAEEAFPHGPPSCPRTGPRYSTRSPTSSRRTSRDSL